MRPAPVDPRGPGGAAGTAAHEAVSAPQQRILDALAELAGVGFPEAEKDMLAGFVRVSSSSGGFRNNLSALRTAGLIDYPSPGSVALTPVGRKAARPRAAPATARDVRERVGDVLSAPQGAILDALLQAHPSAMRKDDLAAVVGVSATSGGFRNNLSRLRTLGTIDYPSPGEARAKDWLKLRKPRG